MIYLQYASHSITPDELRDITNQIEDTTIQHGKSPRAWVILSEDEVKREYDVTWTEGKLEEAQTEIDELKDEIEDLQELYDEIYNELNTLRKLTQSPQ